MIDRKLGENLSKKWRNFGIDNFIIFFTFSGVGGTAFWLGSRSGQLAAYLSTITSKMPITGRYDTSGCDFAARGQEKLYIILRRAVWFFDNYHLFGK